MSNYLELLKDPRWQKKRLHILSAFGWACSKCDDREHELHVHHKYYTSGKKPWEYPTDCFTVLCSKCHKIEHGLMQNQNNYQCFDGRPVRSIREIMIDFIDEQLKKLKRNG